eukprot:4474964-Prymnesium_polylepis.1
MACPPVPFTLWRVTVYYARARVRGAVPRAPRAVRRAASASDGSFCRTRVLSSVIADLGKFARPSATAKTAKSLALPGDRLCVSTPTEDAVAVERT